MDNFISNLRNKPESVRIKILWVSVVVCMIVVVGIWFIDLKGKIQQDNEDTSLKEAVNNLVEDVNVGNTKTNIQTNIGNLLEKNNQASSTMEDQENGGVENKEEQKKAYQLPIE